MLYAFFFGLPEELLGIVEGIEIDTGRKRQAKDQKQQRKCPGAAYGRGNHQPDRPSKFVDSLVTIAR